MRKPKGILKQASSGSTTATSKQSSRINLGEHLRKEIRSLDSESRRLVGDAINDAARAWGNPHLHAGCGIRKLNQNHFECRSGLKTRLVFQDFGEKGLFFIFIGNHDQVRRFIKSQK